MKTCSKCNTEKDPSQYHKQATSRDGLRGQCKSCRSGIHAEYYKETADARIDYQKAYRKENPKKVADMKKDWRLRNLDRAREGAMRYVTRKRAQTPELTDEEKARVEHVYWMALDCSAVSGETYHVDHIHPVSKGGQHHPDNIQVMHWQDNLRKGNRT